MAFDGVAAQAELNAERAATGRRTGLLRLTFWLSSIHGPPGTWSGGSAEADPVSATAGPTAGAAVSHLVRCMSHPSLN